MPQYASVRPRRLADLNPAELDARDRSLDAITKMRRRGLSLKAAAHEAGTTPKTVQKYAGSALTRDGRRWHVTSSDRIHRRQPTIIVGPNGRPTKALVETYSSRQASEIGKHNSDISTLLSVRSSRDARSDARARLDARHGKRAGPTAHLIDGTAITNPTFFGVPPDIVDAYDTLDLGDIDYGSSASTRAPR